uniref:hypothetical protein n=1 Tax=Streptomyces harbinensis TaxID=1176198 RepID=UPI003F6A086C
GLAGAVARAGRCPGGRYGGQAEAAGAGDAGTLPSCENRDVTGGIVVSGMAGRRAGKRNAPAPPATLP